MLQLLILIWTQTTSDFYHSRVFYALWEHNIYYMIIHNSDTCIFAEKVS